MFHPRAPATSPRRQLHTTARRLHPRGGGGIPSKTAASPQQRLHLASWATSPLHHVSMATFPQFRLHLPRFLHPMQGYQGRKGSADDTLPHPTLPALTAPAVAAAGAKTFGAWRRLGPFLVDAWWTAAGSPLLDAWRTDRCGWDGWRRPALRPLLPSALPWWTGRRGWDGRRWHALRSPSSRRLSAALRAGAGGGRRPAPPRLSSVSGGCDTRSPGAAALGTTVEVALFFAGEGRPGVGGSGSIDLSPCSGGEMEKHGSRRRCRRWRVGVASPGWSPTWGPT
nr:uncharacterized protein LOC127332549 [Lolium perenne]